jgi:hypothetical protein
MVIPTLAQENGEAPLVEGGYIPFSLSRAGAYKDPNLNTTVAMMKILPRVSSVPPEFLPPIFTN